MLVHPKTTLLALEGDMGWNSCRIRQHINMILLWNRLIYINENTLSKRVFKWDYIICKLYCFVVKDIFSSIQLQMVYDDMNACSLNTIECNLAEHRNNQWKDLLTSKAKLHTYMKFKDNIYTEQYVQYCSFRKRRSFLAQFQLGILPLHIETGRFRNMKSIEQLCFICNTNVIEDEQHFTWCVMNIHRLEK